MNMLEDGVGARDGAQGIPSAIFRSDNNDDIDNDLDEQ